MVGGLGQLGPQRATAEFGDWTTRIAHGELPAQAPPRPQGIERNVVITQWDWADPKAYLHDEISTDKRNPSRQRQRPDLRIAGREPRLSAGARSGAQHHQPGESSLSRSRIRPASRSRSQPSPFWGDEAIWDSHTTVHNPMFDEHGPPVVHRRASARTTIPAFCKAGSEPAFGEAHAASIAPAANWRCTIRRPSRLSMIDTCFATHHLLFAEDANNTLWTSSGGGGGVVGWLNTQDVGPDARRAEIAGLDGAGARHQRQRQARCLRGGRAEGRDTAPSGESLGTSAALHAHATDPDQGHAPQRRVLWSRRSARTG